MENNENEFLKTLRELQKAVIERNSDIKATDIKIIIADTLIRLREDKIKQRILLDD